ncbi:glycine--tRNA ligase [Polymorphospora rubra]|uniref:Multifunctional fusion protein n=2 Tax=Polymorphospora rubra TaxID=338584 RepID=A0A810MU55_9ACTN|nr:glycine--tRNA ligase [Polymorphospora rubra]
MELPDVLTMQDALARLAAYWGEQGCLTVQPMNTEVGAGTLNPATFLRVLGPEPWRVAYVEPSVRPDDARYGENPNRVQTHTQFQVILKPEPGNSQELYLGSLAALGIDVAAHDVRFVEDNWASPALGAWGLGWEVWLDGLEITQFTYFQQAGGINLDPPAVEITYGLERILMALQGVRHFKEIAYTDTVSYGELFGQGEYEMSRYYLDDADIAANRSLLQLYAAEAQRMIDAGLPVPAHTYVLKCSHAFNVLDARGAVSTAERATEFARMRKLAGDVARLWMERRAELDHPLGVCAPIAVPGAVDVDLVPRGPEPRAFVCEVGTEEMPPVEGRAAAGQLARELEARLAATRLAHGRVTVRATPRRLVALVEEVAAREEDQDRVVKGPKAAAAFDAAGNPTPAVRGFARAQGVEVADLVRQQVGNAEHMVLVRREIGRGAPEVLAGVVEGAVGALRSGRNMRWNDPKLAFTRPIRWLLALWGDQVVPARVSALVADRRTRVLRTAPAPEITVDSAESYVETVEAAGIVLDHADRRSRIIEGARALSAGVAGHVDIDGESGLIEQVAFLVEQPTPLLGGFDESYLSLPEAVLATVMRKHQRYLPVRGADGRLLPYFVAVANGPVDVDLVRAGNEAVLRARYEDALFFYRTDREAPLAVMRERLARLTFTDRLGSVAERADRIGALARRLADEVGLDGPDRAVLDRAAELVKFDLGSQLVTEMTSLAGTMARDYAAHAGEPAAVAEALFEAERPRNTEDALPRGAAGELLSVADRLDLLTGLAATVGLPTGSSDQFALRRAALGLLGVFRRRPVLAPVSLRAALGMAAQLQPVPVSDEVLEAVAEFVTRRFEQQLTEEDQPVDRIRAVLPHADRPYLLDRILAQLAKQVEQPGFQQLTEALQRARRIVPAGTPAEYDPGVLVEPAEVALHDALVRARAGLGEAPDLDRFVEAVGGIVRPVNTFFDDVFVMVDDEPLRRARLGLLASVADLGAPVLAWEHLRM